MAPIKEDVKETAKEGIQMAGKMADAIAERPIKVIERLVAALDNRETELRLNFENLTLNGGIALSWSLLQKKE